MESKVFVVFIVAALCFTNGEDKKEEATAEGFLHVQCCQCYGKYRLSTLRLSGQTITKYLHGQRLHPYGRSKFYASYITPCHVAKDFDNCVRKQIEISLPHFTKGIPELGVPSIDPVDLEDIKIDGNGLKLLFTEAKMFGLSTSQLTDFKVNLRKETFSMSFKVNITVKAKYVIDGQILILPIRGNGDAEVITRNIEVLIKSKINSVNDSKGITHLKLNTPSYTYKIEKTMFKFQNLFNGNKQLSDATHQFANENWRQIMDDVAPPAVKQIVKNTIKVINKFFSKVSAQQIILGYDDLHQSIAASS